MLFVNTGIINGHIVDENNDTKVEIFLHCVVLSNKHFIDRLTRSYTTRGNFNKFTLCVLTRSYNVQGCGQITGNAMYSCLSFII